MTYSLWLEPTGDIVYKLQERIKQLSQKFNTPLFSPHVTLLGGLTASQTELVPLIETLASSVAPFEVKLTKAGYLNTFYQALFIHVEQSQDLKKLHGKACRIIDCPDEYKNHYMPHLSLLYGELTQKEKERILNNIGREFHLRFTAKKLVLIQTDDKPNKWKKIHTSMFRRQ
ncbi:MAG: 2'-5' RNA ligase family protein [Bacteroidota bacterium]